MHTAIPTRRTIHRILTLALALLLASPAFSQAVQRLILTDGSYQTATEWKRDGDRIRYLSAERGEWEELPNQLIDWKATNQWNADRVKAQAEDVKEMKQVSEAEIAARKEAMSNNPLVAPDVRLPSQGGVFLMESVDGKPKLIKIDPNKIEENDHVGQNMVRKSIIPIASQVQTIELKGASAKARVHSPIPTIFVDEDNEEGAIPAEDFRLVRLERKRDQRVLATNKIGITGEQNVTEKFLHSRSESVSGAWWKLIPLENLPPGEYAIVISGRTANSNTAVWDFGIDK